MAESEERMSEVITNQVTMYDSVEAVHNLNSVEGFNPRSFMRIIQGEGESAKYYLDVAFRKLWFRLKYPEGRISKRLLKLENDMAVIEARVYLNYRDAEDQFVANAFSHKFRADDSQFGSSMWNWPKLPQQAGHLPTPDLDFSLQTVKRKQIRRWLMRLLNPVFCREKETAWTLQKEWHREQWRLPE